jgi:hypothetical protein
MMKKMAAKMNFSYSDVLDSSLLEDDELLVSYRVDWVK